MGIFIRSLCAAMFAVFFLSFSHANSQGWYPYNPACTLSTEGCSSWLSTSVEVELPQYPGCQLILRYQLRYCPDQPHNIEEITVQEVYWVTPGNPSDTGHPCYGVNNAYLSTPAPLKKDFLYQLFQDVVTTHFESKFNAEYRIDSLQAANHPGDPQWAIPYLSLLCNNGTKTYRVINGLCMAAITKPDVPFTGIFNRTEEGGEKGASITGDPPESATNYMRVRYYPCNESLEAPCCVQLLRYCRNPNTWKTELQMTGTIIGAATACSLTVVPPGVLEPGETSTGCRDYCLDYQPGTQENGNGKGPDLSGRVKPGEIWQGEKTDTMYGAGSLTNRAQ